MQSFLGSKESNSIQRRIRKANKRNGAAGVMVGGKLYKPGKKGFSQFKVKPAGKKTTKEKMRGGIMLAII